MDNFVGFKWFTYLFESEATRADIFRVIKNTLGLSAIGILTSWLPMAFAIFLTQVPSKRFRRFVQTFTTVPNLQDSLILMSHFPGLYTMQHRLWIYLNASSNLAASMQGGGAVAADMLNNKVIKYTISMVTVIHIMLVYPFMQRYFEEGIMLGAVKG